MTQLSATQMLNQLCSIPHSYVAAAALLGAATTPLNMAEHELVYLKT